MEHTTLHDWAKSKPFVPFVVTVSEGREVRVTNPEMVLLGRRYNVVGFVDGEGYDRHVIIHHNHINTIDAYDPVQSAAIPA